MRDSVQITNDWKFPAKFLKLKLCVYIYIYIRWSIKRECVVIPCVLYKHKKVVLWCDKSRECVSSFYIGFSDKLYCYAGTRDQRFNPGRVGWKTLLAGRRTYNECTFPRSRFCVLRSYIKYSLWTIWFNFAAYYSLGRITCRLVLMNIMFENDWIHQHHRRENDINASMCHC